MWFWLILGITTIIVSIHAIVTKKFAYDPIPLWMPKWMKNRIKQTEYLHEESHFWHYYGKSAVIQGYFYLVLGILFTLYIAYQMIFVKN